MACTPFVCHAGIVPNLDDLIPRWIRHAVDLSLGDLLVATYVHVRTQEYLMADLTQAITDLEAAVAAVPARITAAVEAASATSSPADAATIADLQAQLAAAQQANATAGDQIVATTAAVTALAP